MNFTQLDEILKKYPSDINRLIYSYFTTDCDECFGQIYCYECELYTCQCEKTINHCNVDECHRMLCCLNSNRIHIGEDSPYLCDRCWNIDICEDVQVDILLELNNYENCWWCVHQHDY